MLAAIKARQQFLPVIVFGAGSDLPLAIEAMKAGAADYVGDPVRGEGLLNSINHVLAHSCYRCKYSSHCIGRVERWDSLTRRQKQIMGMILSGNPSKNIAADLGVSQRTVENHRARIMQKTGASSIAELARVSLSTQWHGIGECPPCFAA